MKHKESEFSNYKYDRSQICTNPDIEFEHSGNVVEYQILIARHNIGYSAGYKYRFKHAPQQLGTQVWSFCSMPTRGTAFSKKDDALYETSNECRKAIYNQIKLVPGLSLTDINPLIKFIQSIPKTGNNSINNKNINMAKETKKGIAALIDKPIKDAAPAGPGKSNVLDIKLSAIIPSATNPRKTFEKENIQDLADSMKSVGLLQAIILRPLADGFEIVAGERRYRAALHLKWETIPGLVRDISDDEMLEIQIIENLQREDVSPLDEAHAFKTLLQKENIDWLASRIHKTKKYIADRLKLNDLVPEAAEHVSAGTLPLGHAVVISKLSFADQQACIRKCISKSYGENTDEDYCKIPLEELKDFISDTIMLEFKKAPFDPDDAILYENAGACKVCPKRTCNSNLLFQDITKDDKCTDASCFNEKIKLHIDREKGKAKEQYGKVLSGEKSSYTGSKEIKVQGVMVAYSETPVKNAIPVVVTKLGTYDHDRSKLGKTVYIDAKKIDQVKLAKEDAKKENKSPKAETYEQRLLRELKENWSRIEFVVKNHEPVPAIINTFLRSLLSEIDDRALFAFAGLSSLAPALDTPEAAAKYNLKPEEKTKLLDQFISVYSVEELLMITQMLTRFDDEPGEKVGSWQTNTMSWDDLMNVINPPKKDDKKPKKKVA